MNKVSLFDLCLSPCLPLLTISIVYFFTMFEKPQCEIFVSDTFCQLCSVIVFDNRLVITIIVICEQGRVDSKCWQTFIIVVLFNFAFLLICRPSLPVTLALKTCSQNSVHRYTAVDGICKPPLFTNVVKAEALPASLYLVAV